MKIEEIQEMSAEMMTICIECSPECSTEFVVVHVRF